jgi:hypothetical protein
MVAKERRRKAAVAGTPAVGDKESASKTSAGGQSER